jgi:SAM-dependent methyltransferase
VRLPDWAGSVTPYLESPLVSEPRFDVAQVFDEDYLYFYGPSLEEVSEADTDVIWRLLELELEPGSEVLDLACGHGRIASRLAQRGARVTGLDATPVFLDSARARGAAAGLPIEYIQGDMRSLPRPDDSFDRVISWFTSFGYFEDEENRGVLREARRVLRPGGRLLIENNNLAELLPRWLPSVVAERDGGFSIDRATFDPITGRSTTRRVIIRDGRIRRFGFSVRMFVACELRDWMLQAGFDTAEFCDHAGARLTADAGEWSRSLTDSPRRQHPGLVRLKLPSVVVRSRGVARGPRGRRIPFHLCRRRRPPAATTG